MKKMFSVLIISLFNLAITAAQNEFFRVDECVAVPDLFIQNQTRKLQCCQTIIDNLYNSWYYQGAYLSRTLATLKAWNCPQFDEVCSNRLLSFTDYSSLVYDRFCNESSLIQKCGLVVSEALSAIRKFYIEHTFKRNVYNIMYPKTFVTLTLYQALNYCKQFLPKLNQISYELIL